MTDKLPAARRSTDLPSRWRDLADVFTSGREYFELCAAELEDLQAKEQAEAAAVRKEVARLQAAVERLEGQIDLLVGP